MSFQQKNASTGLSWELRGALHNSLRMGVVQVGMSCKAHFAVQ